MKRTTSFIDRLADRLSTPARTADIVIQGDLLKTIVGRTTLILFGGLCVISTDIVYAFLIDPLIGLILTTIAAIGIVQRITTTRAASDDIDVNPRSRRKVILTGLAWGAIVGFQSAVWTLSGNFLLVLMGGCVTTGLGFGAIFTNAAAPRFAKVQILAITSPFLFISPLLSYPNMKLMLTQAPIWITGIFVTINSAYATAAALMHAKNRIKFLSENDELTGLSNRLHMMEKYFADRKKVEDYESYVLFMDLDGFKDVNDKYGHATGDELLQAVAHRLSASLRTEDSLARMGGDEFVAVLRNLTCSQVQTTATRIVQQLSRPFDLTSVAAVRIGISIGGARLGLGTPSEALRRADELLYRAKGAGKGTVRLDCACPLSGAPPAAET